MNIAKEKRAIQYLKMFEPEEEPYYGCYSGGKDSDVIRILLNLARVACDLVHNLTTVDWPETVKYVKSVPGVIIQKPETTMWDLIVKNGVYAERITNDEHKGDHFIIPPKNAVVIIGNIHDNPELLKGGA